MNLVKNKKNVLAVILVVVLVITGLLYLFLQKDNLSLNTSGIKSEPVKDSNSTQSDSSEGDPSASGSFPFQELTIPHLRQISYESELGEMEKVSENANYTSYVTSYDSDGLRINGLLTIPNDDEPENGWPAVVFVHGYIPPKEYRTRQNYISWIDFLAKNEYVVFKIDLRGHDESEGNPGGAYYSSDYIIDTLNAYSALQSANFINPEKIGLWGHSMAGNVVLRSMAVKKDIPAAVIWAGAVYTYSDMQEYRIDDDSYVPPPGDSERARERRKLRENYGNFDPEHWFWKQVPATNYLEGVTGAVQLNHALNDSVVDIGYSRNLISLLEKTEIVHEFNEYPTGGHNLTGVSFNLALQRTKDFFERYVKD